VPFSTIPKRPKSSCKYSPKLFKASPTSRTLRLGCIFVLTASVFFFEPLDLPRPSTDVHRLLVKSARFEISGRIGPFLYARMMVGRFVLHTTHYSTLNKPQVPLPPCTVDSPRPCSLFSSSSSWTLPTFPGSTFFRSTRSGARFCNNERLFSPPFAPPTQPFWRNKPLPASGSVLLRPFFRGLSPLTHPSPLLIAPQDVFFRQLVRRTSSASSITSFGQLFVWPASRSRLPAGTEVFPRILFRYSLPAHLPS